MAQFTYKLTVWRNNGTEHVDFFFEIDDYAQLQTVKSQMAAQGWVDYATWTLNDGVWYYTGGGPLAPPEDEIDPEIPQP